MNAQENNILIARFMGYNVINYKGRQIFDDNKYYKTVGELRKIWGGLDLMFTGRFCNDVNYPFNLDWRYIMPIVFKCLGICHKNMLNEWEEAFKDSFMACNIETVYKITIEFIKWYNLNQVEPQLKEQTCTA